MKNLLGLLFSVLLIFSALSAYAYETVILHKPDRNWIAYSYEKNEETGDVTAKFIPKYDNKFDWNEMLIIRSFKEAKKANDTADSFIGTVLAETTRKHTRIERNPVKNDEQEAIVTWCGYGGTLHPVCGVARVVVGVESIISMEYLLKDTNNFEPRKQAYVKLFEEAVVYNSYYRWDKTMNKALCVEL